MTTLLSGGAPVEVTPGGGDLRRSSLPGDVFFEGAPFWRGRPISYARIFASQPWAGIAVMRLLSWSVRVPLKVYRRIDDKTVERLRPADHPLARAVVQPWGRSNTDRGNMAELVTGMLGPLLVHGNDLTHVDEGARNEISFDPLDWRMVTPLRFDQNDPNADIQGWKVRQGLDSYERSADTVMHLRWWSPLGRFGISPLEQIRTSILGDDLAAEWGISNLKQAARPSGVVELTDELLGREPHERQAVLDQTRAQLRDAYSGVEGAGKLPVLPPGLKWQNVDHTTAVEAELIAQRHVYRNEVAAIYMIPPPMIGQLEKATYSNIQTQREMAYTDGLAPPLILIEQKINSHLVAGLLRENDVFVEFDFAGILRGDRLKEIQALREAIGSALLTPNEGREILNRPSFGDDTPENTANKLWIGSNNLKPIDAPIAPLKGASN